MISTNIDNESQITSAEFVDALLAALACHNRLQIPIEDPTVEYAFSRVLTTLERFLDDPGASDHFKIAVDNIILDLSPDPNTGAWDRMWSALRGRQPISAGMMNPAYKSVHIRIGRADATNLLNEMPEKWRPIIHESADVLSAVM